MYIKAVFDHMWYFNPYHFALPAGSSISFFVFCLIVDFAAGSPILVAHLHSIENTHDRYCDKKLHILMVSI
jgi:hypothetical protein